ncbi:WXG100 family type VII secretion target [Streptomyces sp. ISL-22]|uniref:WXG100 family type VII secretion target n=1 Tax=unclassified Streptomyces TaxID=2593676 RepID=UPI001BEC0CD8|nr:MULTISPECIES: WXG100 family type VII secretion target [unclassified Streptomyces]MBT2421286.1 WXG100 family type VII secretion target [Streptomyces sp. ISL-24]MBT2437039.1 WXG100 family type VII secretion target [Streptomyces sp. ISL-22]
MSGNESVAEEIIELGIEVINPGGRPDELKAAAKAWRQLKSEVEGLVKDLDKDVKATVGNTWRGEAANAFQAHWDEFAAALLSATDDFDEAAKGLEDAAENIEQVNKEIHDIYVEIGISIGVSVGMSFLTLGVSAAAGTARVTMLVTRALDAAGRLGQLLRAIATAFRTLYSSGKAGKLLAEGLLNWAGGTAGGMITSQLSGKGWEVGTNMIGGLTGATVGTAAGKAVTAAGGKEILSGMAGGAAGGMSGDYLDSLRKGEDYDIRQSAVTGIAGGAAGGLAGGARAIDRGLDDAARGLKNESDFAFSGDRPEHQQTGIDVGFAASIPVAGGVSANTAKDGFDGVDKSVDEAQKATVGAVEGDRRTATDRIREDFG